MRQEFEGKILDAIYQSGKFVERLKERKCDIIRWRVETFSSLQESMTLHLYITEAGKEEVDYVYDSSEGVFLRVYDDGVRA